LRLNRLILKERFANRPYNILKKRLIISVSTLPKVQVAQAKLWQSVATQNLQTNSDRL